MSFGIEKDGIYYLEGCGEEFFYTVDDHERASRLRTSTYVCADYQVQTEEYFTYNDYLYYIK